jgi:adenosine deaminase
MSSSFNAESGKSMLALSGQKDIVLIQALEVLAHQGIGIRRLSVFSTPQKKEAFASLKAYTIDRCIHLTLAAPEGNSDFSTKDDYLNFEENCLRWYAAELASDPHPLAFLGAGNKLMVAAFQKAAQVFGATSVYHILAERGTEPSTLPEIVAAIEQNKLLCIDTGKEPGWPEFRWLGAENLPVLAFKDDWYSLLAKPETRTLRELIENRMARLQEYITGDNGAHDVPFPVLLMLPPNILAWLDSPLENSESDSVWIQSLPKTDLHCHLGGFAASGPELINIRNAAEDDLPQVLDIEFPPFWPLPDKPVPLDEYMRLGNNNGSYILSDSGCLVAQCRALYSHFQKEKVLYAEIRCSPGNYQKGRKSSSDVLSLICRTFQEEMEQARRAPGASYCHINLIIIATRKKDRENLSSISRHLALAVTSAGMVYDSAGCQVVGVDLAGYESRETRPLYFRDDFKGIHRCGLALTVHAGENDDAESIWSAVFDLNTRRIGHALHLADSPELLQSVIDRRIGVEMCPYANYQIKGFHPMREVETAYPLRNYLQKGVHVSVNTDNIGISGAGISDNLMFLSTLCPGITRLEILRLLRNGLESAFISTEHRSRLLAEFSRQIADACLANFNET